LNNIFLGLHDPFACEARLMTVTHLLSAYVPNTRKLYNFCTRKGSVQKPRRWLGPT